MKADAEGALAAIEEELIAKLSARLEDNALLGVAALERLQEQTSGWDYGGHVEARGAMRRLLECRRGDSNLRH